MPQAVDGGSRSHHDVTTCRHTRRYPPDGGREARARAHDCDIAVMIGTSDGYCEPRHLGHQQRGRMAVVVVQADADYCHPGMHRCEKRGIEIRRAMVRHLEHVGAHVGADAEHRLLCLDLDVAGQQDPDIADRCPKNQRGIVRIGAGPSERHPRRQHFHVDATDVEKASHGGCGDRQAVLGQRTTNQFHPARRLGEGPGHNTTHNPVVEHADDAADMVEVVVSKRQ